MERIPSLNPKFNINDLELVVGAIPMKKITPKNEYLKKVKIDRYLSKEGVCSRSEAVILAESGNLFVNGQLIIDVEKRIDAHKDIVEIKQQTKQLADYIVVINKPSGIVSQIMKSPIRPANSLLTEDTYATYIKGKCADVNIIAKNKKNFYPLGSLEKESHGLLVLTNNKKLLKKMTVFEAYLEREFLISLDKPMHRKLLDKLYKGILIGDFLIKPLDIKIEEGNQLRLTLHSDFKNQIYQILGKAGIKPVEIQCVRIGKFKLGTLKPGQWVVIENAKEILGR